MDTDPAGTSPAPTTTRPEALVIESDAGDDLRRLGDWLTGAGLRLRTLRPYAGDALPADPTEYAALIVLGAQRLPETGPLDPDRADPGLGGDPAPASSPRSWLPAGRSLLRAAVRHRVPTLAIGLGAHLLATAHGGTVAPAAAGPGLGPALVARRDAADQDPLFADVPFTPDVLLWHRDELTELPAGAVLLASSPRYPHQAFRIGPVAWGLQFHIEPDEAMVAGWLADALDLLRQLGRDPAQLRTAAAAVMDDLAAVWQPFAARFAALARGELATAPTDLPVLGR